MIKNIFKPLSAHLRSFSFSSYHDKVLDPFSNTSYPEGPIKKAKDAQRIFEQFFRQNPPKQCQKSLFDLGYFQKKETGGLDPYKILGIPADATKEKINHAYRELALKYHPKNDSSQEAGQKFVNIAWAYEVLNKKKTNKAQQQLSLMNNFNESVQQFMDNELGVNTTKGNNNSNNKVKIAELYSQSKNIKKFGGQKQVTIEREYNRDGKLLKITRNEIYKQDGSVEVCEILDDGQEIKTIKLIKQNEQNQMRFVNQTQD